MQIALMVKFIMWVEIALEAFGEREMGSKRVYYSMSAECERASVLIGWLYKSYPLWPAGDWNSLK